ncbi:cytochrome P450 [Sorangium sp. So ce291]|uniref:cytochrome P450 n=1 Tax=Sorangium sp. So ce291 TaxID=3133294 RepID=UPI003F5F26C9
MSSSPGPKGHPLHGSWPEFRADPLAFLLDGTLAYGDFFRFRLGLQQCFAVSDPAAIQKVFSDREGFTDKTPPHRMQDAYPRSVARLEGSEHLERRRALAPAFQREAVLARAEGAARVVREALGRLRTGEARAALPVLEDVALRSASMLLLGDAGERVVEHIATELPRVEAWLAHAADDEAAYDQAREALAASIREAAEHRRAAGSPGTADLLDPLVRAVDAGQMDEQAMIDEIVMMLVTHVPTAAASAWALHELAQRPEVRSSLEEELDATGAHGAEVERASLLSAVVLETLRLHPPVWVLAREARREFRHGPHAVSAGNEVLVSPYVMQRLPRYWKRPEAFLPERFLPGSPWHEDRPSAAFLPFGLGIRKCIGERTAILQMKLMLAALVREFRFELPAGYEAGVGGRRPLVPRDGLPLVLERRSRTERWLRGDAVAGGAAACASSR